MAKKQLNLRQVEIAITDLFYGNADDPHARNVCRALTCSHAQLVACLRREASTHGYYYSHWRAFRDVVLERHGCGDFVPMDAPYGQHYVFIPAIRGASWAARWSHLTTKGEAPTGELSMVINERRLTLHESIEAMRAIPAKWKHLAHPIAEMQRIRNDPDYSPWENPEWAVPFAPCCAACNCDVPTRSD